MKSLTLELQTGKKKVKIPESWDEINLETFTRIENEFGYDFSKMITLFSILTGVPIAPIEKSEQPNLDVQLFTMMQYVSKPPKWEDLEKPKKLTIKGKVVKCRYDFRTTSLGQKLTMSSLIRDKPNPIDAIPEVIAIFLQPTIDGEYDREKSQELMPEIMKLNCKDAFTRSIEFIILSFFARKTSRFPSNNHCASIFRGTVMELLIGSVIS